MVLKQERARSFGSAAAEYARHRTGYSTEAVHWALRPITERSPIDLLDLGAGTGKLTQSLMQLPGAQVVAVEPDPAMIAQLRTLLPTVDSRTGTAEDIPLPDASVDAVLVGQAWHWFDQRLALRELARVLRPGGVFAALWNGEDTSAPWVAGFREANGWEQRAGKADPDRRGFPEHPAFGATEHKEFTHSVPTTVDGMLRWLGTHSWVITLPEQERADLLHRVRTHLESHPQTAGDTFDFSLTTTVLRAVRL